MQEQISRRRLLEGGAGLFVAASVAGCSAFSTNPTDKKSKAGNTAANVKEKESPQLAALVKQGKLPALGERLPKNPLVVKPLNGAGVYGGTWHSCMVGEDDTGWLQNAPGYEPEVRLAPKADGGAATQGIIANVCEYEVHNGGREYVLRIRDGLKWSDGTPCTAEDLMFGMVDVTLSTDLHPDGLYDLFLENGSTDKVVKVEQQDERTVRFTYQQPKAGFLYQIAVDTFLKAGPYGFLLPKHYLKQFHKKYNPGADSLAKKAQLTDWTALFTAKQDPYHNSDEPTLYAWKVTTPIGASSAVVLDRNPYFWKVDQQGRQLPYIDQCRVEIVQDVQVEMLKLMNGEIEMQFRNFDTPQNKPVLAQNRTKGSYQFIDMPSNNSNTMIIDINQTIKDPVKQKLYRNKNFRIGLSYAINRKNIIDAVYAGQGEPWQAAPSKHSPAYNERLAKQYTEYSKAKANQYLDKAGLTKRNSSGMRLGADGKPVTLTIMVDTDFPDHTKVLEFVQKDWKAVGIGLTIQPVADALFSQREQANQQEAATWTCTDWDPVAGTGGNHYYVPSNNGSTRYGVLWAQWYVDNGKDGEEPPPEVKKQLQLWTTMRTTYDAQKAATYAKQILDIAADQFYSIGISSYPNDYGIVKNTMHNVPLKMHGTLVTPGPTNPEQYYIS